MAKSNGELEELLRKHAQRSLPGIVQGVIDWPQFRRSYRTLITKVIIPAMRELETKTLEENTETLTERLAKEFSAVITEWLDPKDLKRVNELNASTEYQDFCATHNYCDANMAMDKAWNKILRRPFSVSSDSDTYMLNTAWAMAKLNKFKVVSKFNISKA